MKAKSDQNEFSTKLAYKKVEKWTLVESLAIAFTGNDGTERKSTLTLSNLKLNQPIPAGVFVAEKR